MNDLDLYALFDNINVEAQFTDKNFVCIIGEKNEKIIESRAIEQIYCADTYNICEKATIICNYSDTIQSNDYTLIMSQYGEFFCDLLVDYPFYSDLFNEYRFILDKVCADNQNNEWTKIRSYKSDMYEKISQITTKYFLDCIQSNKLDELENIISSDLDHLRDRFFRLIILELLKRNEKGLEILNILTDFRYALYNNKDEIITLREFCSVFKAGMLGENLVVGNCLERIESIQEIYKCKQRILTLDMNQNPKDILKNII